LIGNVFGATTNLWLTSTSADTSGFPKPRWAQQGDRVRRIGVLMPYDENDPESKRRVSAFTQALADLGWIDGRNVRMHLRWGGDDINRIRALARELVGLQPDIVMSNGTLTTAALQRETQTIPIVFVFVSDPVASGLVPRLDHPSGNMTGFAAYEASMGGKWLELLSEIAPGFKRAAIIFNPDLPAASTYMPSLQAAARSLKFAPISAPVQSDIEIEKAIMDLRRELGGGLIVIQDIFTTAHRASIILAAARNNVPAIYLCEQAGALGGVIGKLGALESDQDMTPDAGGVLDALEARRDDPGR
jgi:putative ABC transport system substrate-binding protein